MSRGGGVSVNVLLGGVNEYIEGEVCLEDYEEMWIGDVDVIKDMNREWGMWMQWFTWIGEGVADRDGGGGYDIFVEMGE